MDLTELRTKKESLEWELENNLLFQDSFKKDLKKVNAKIKQALEIKIAKLEQEIETSIFSTAKEKKQLEALKAELASF